MKILKYLLICYFYFVGQRPLFRVVLRPCDAQIQNTPKGCDVIKKIICPEGPEERQWFELSNESPQDSPLLRDTSNTSRPKDKGKRKEKKQKQKLETDSKNETKGQREWEKLAGHSVHVSHSRDRNRFRQCSWDHTSSVDAYPLSLYSAIHSISTIQYSP